jgi:hypothetical protein
MTCEHLIDLERALLAAGIKETSRGQAWSQNCREWVYFDCYLDTAAIRRRYKLPDLVEEHSHRGTHDGQEHGLVCSHCHDAIVGLFEPASGKPVFRG